MNIIPTKARVASQTIFTTIQTSLRETTPNKRATTAPIVAVQPMLSPFGCQITKIKVIKNIKTAITV